MRSTESASGAKAPLRSAADAEALVVATIQQHADALLRAARSHSFCADDAADAYQRALEIFLRRSRTIDVDDFGKWLFRVVINEAHAVRKQRQRVLGESEIDFDLIEARDAPSPEDRALSFDTVARSAEALQRLKPAEVRALWMRASGCSYAEIASKTGWTYTKVNRSITEGRRSFLSHYSDIETGAECVRWAPALSALVDGEATAAQLAELRPHLRNCSACRADLRAMHQGTAALGAVFPVSLAGGFAVSHGDAPGWLARVHEAVAGQLHERVVASMLRLQSAGDIVSAGKLVAVAASAAALAGGGIAVVRRDSPRHAVPVHLTRTAHVAKAKPSAPAVVSRPVSPPARQAPPATPRPTRHVVSRAGDFSPEVMHQPAAHPHPHPRPAAAPSGSDAQEFAP